MIGCVKQYSTFVADLHCFKENVWVKIFWWFIAGGNDDHRKCEYLYIVCNKIEQFWNQTTDKVFGNLCCQDGAVYRLWFSKISFGAHVAIVDSIILQGHMFLWRQAGFDSLSTTGFIIFLPSPVKTTPPSYLNF